MLKSFCIIITLLVISISAFQSHAQPSISIWQKSDTLNKNRRNAVYISEISAGTLTLIGLNQLWYATYPKSSFHIVNDNNQWLQMDKIGHLMTSYYVGKVGIELLDWAGESKKNQLIYGATLGVTFLTAVEILDGFSKEWGFSVGDFAANISGTGLLIGQELLWNEQRIGLKYSFHNTTYAAMRPEILGSSFLEQAIKDYNGQTYWLSANIWSFNKTSRFPKWLNIAFGYGADGLLSGSKETTETDLFPDQQRYRQFYLSLDLDLTKIKTRSKLLKTVFSTLNFIKIPAPTIEFSAKNNTKFYLVYF